MGKKFKLVTVLFIGLILIIAPIGLLILPSWNSKVTPLLNLVDTLLAEGGEEKISLESFSFVGKDDTSLTLRIDLGIDNTGGPEMLFPAVNLTFNYGASKLGYGWISEEVLIPANSPNTTIPIYARMFKGDAFNKFFMGLIGGGLSFSISAGEAFVFLETIGKIPLGSLSIPLPSIPLPSIELTSPAYPPSCHGLLRGEVTPMADVEIKANVSDRGGGIKEVILSWDNGSGWVNTTMTDLPLKDLMGGSNTFLGNVFNMLFPLYPNSTIPTSYGPVIVSANIPGQSSGIVVKYRVYVIDVFNHSTLVPSTPPTNESGQPTNDTVDLINNYFNYTVPAGTLLYYNATWVEAAEADEPDMMTDMLATLEQSGIDLVSLIFAGSELLAGFSDLKIDLADIEGSIGPLLDLFKPLIEYLDKKGVNPFEMLDQLIGFSGGMPGLPVVIEGPQDKNYTINANTTIGMDMLLESGLGLLDLMQFLVVNMTAMIEALADSLLLPVEEMPDKTPAEAIFILLNETRYDATKLEEFISFLVDKDAFYVDFPLLLLKYNITDEAVIDKTGKTIQLSGSVGDSYYLGSPLTEGLIVGEFSTSNFTIINIEMSNAVNNFVNGSTYLWEYSNGTDWKEITQWKYFNGTQWLVNATEVSRIANFTQSGRIQFILPENMGTSLFAGNNTYWIRVNISAAGVTTPVANSITYSREIMDYYYTSHNVDLLGRPQDQITPGETDSIINMIWAANESNDYAMKLLSILGLNSITYNDLLEKFGATTFIVPPPVSGSQILNASSIPMAFIVYAILLFVMLCSVRGRKGTYAIAPARVKKWYESNLLMPSAKTREALELFKEKSKRG